MEPFFTPYIPVDFPTPSGKSPRQIITEYWSQKVTVDGATKLYNMCLQVGMTLGTPAYGDAIRLVCDTLGLSSTQLEYLTTGTTTN